MFFFGELSTQRDLFFRFDPQWHCSFFSGHRNNMNSIFHCFMLQVVVLRYVISVILFCGVTLVYSLIFKLCVL